MGSRIQFCLLVIFFQILIAAARTDNGDLGVLNALKDIWTNYPPNWVGDDPCGSSWDGIGCNNSRVTSITLSTMGLNGTLSGDMADLDELQTLDLSYNKGLTGSLPAAIGNIKKLSTLILIGCSFGGPIPATLGSLQRLTYLALNSNRFTGQIPRTLGNLSKLVWLDLADNQLTETIPVSDGVGTPGLDMLLKAKHFHFRKNQLSGQIPPQLFSSNMELIHVSFESNQLTGNIPSTLGLVQALEVVRLDGNSLSGPVPSNLNNLTNVNELHLSNNKLTGPVPNLTGMTLLNYVDMRNNTFDVSDVPSWFSSLQALTTLVMDQTQLRGVIPVSLFSLPQLCSVSLKNNQLNGTLDLGSSYSNQMQRIDLQNNNIEAYTQRPGSTVNLILVGNPVCNGTRGIESYCTLQQTTNSPYSTPPNNCVPGPCSSGQIASPNCRCAIPYKGNLTFRARTILDLDNLTAYTSLQNYFVVCFQSHRLPVDTVSLSNPVKNSEDCLVLNLEIFPSGQDHFNRTGVSALGFVLSSQTCMPPLDFGPFFFSGDQYDYFEGAVIVRTRYKYISIGLIIGAAVGGSLLVLLLLLTGFYAYRQKRRPEIAYQHNNPFALWDTNKSNGVDGVPQLKGARSFTFEELKKYTNNFSKASDIGTGGYGKVYRGTLPTGQLLAIKRAQQGSIQGGLEFKTEIELLSRVHHKNVVGLVGFCFERGEQILVYEYIPNGTLRESLSGRSGIRMDWKRRLQASLGAARGLHYLHELADPPIIHRDIKSNNILLDERLNAKVADFGISKPVGGADQTHATTQVKGTMGYMDPEYYMTQQLTEKSDLYSFGVVLLELITARNPIEKGKYIVREVKQAMDKSKDLYNLQEIVDPIIGSDSTSLKGLERFVDLSLRCVEEEGAARPTMRDVVKEIENIMQLAGLNPNAESASSSATYDSLSKGVDRHPYSNEALFSYSGDYPPSTLDPQ